MAGVTQRIEDLAKPATRQGSGDRSSHLAANSVLSVDDRVALVNGKGITVLDDFKYSL